MKVLCPHQTLPFPTALQGSPTELGAAPLHQIPAPSPSQEGLGSSCHNKTEQQEAWKTPRTVSNAKLVLIGIPPPRERLRCAEIRNPLVTDRAWTLFTSSQTQLKHWERMRMVWRLPEQQREWIISRRSQSWCLRRWGFACSSCTPGTPGCGRCSVLCPALCTPGIIPLGREHGLTPTTPSTTTSKGHPDLSLKGELKT